MLFLLNRDVASLGVPDIEPDDTLHPGLGEPVLVSSLLLLMLPDLTRRLGWYISLLPVRVSKDLVVSDRIDVELGKAL